MSIIGRVKSSVKQLFYYVVGRAARNRDKFLETAEEGEEIVESSYSPIEPWVIGLILIVTVLFQLYVTEFLIIGFLWRMLIVGSVVWLQVKLITIHARNYTVSPEIKPDPA